MGFSSTKWRPTKQCHFVKRHVGQRAVVIREDDNRVIHIAQWEERYWSIASYEPINAISPSVSLPGGLKDSTKAAAIGWRNK